MRPATLILITVPLLGSASVASAECAWVLWEWQAELSAPTVRSWKVLDAYQSKDQCSVGAIAYAQLVKSHLEASGYVVQMAVDGKGVLSRSAGSAKWESVSKDVCLPDTIDPREKKEDDRGR